MNKKIGRNDSCPCGSGKKYKKCCLNKSEEQRLAEAIAYSFSDTKREARIKTCLHPNHNECSDKIAKAHAIQNNRILSLLAENGMVVTMDGVENYAFQTADEKGRGIATIFTGFCSYHDKTLFQEIEDKDFAGTEKQIFLLSYRSMAWHYHKKREQENAVRIQFQKMNEKGYDLSESEQFNDFLSYLTKGLNENDKEKERFDTALLNGQYDVINSWCWEIPYEISFAISMMTEIEHDILGNTINGLGNDEELKHIYLNIFPCQGKSYCIWSWLSESDDIYTPFIQQFSNLCDRDRENYLNNYLPRWSDALVFSPRLWNKWGKDIQESLLTHANFDYLYRQRERETGNYKYEYAYTPWNFFENISI